MFGFLYLSYMGPWVHFFACTESNEYSNRRVADRQALLGSHVIPNEIALEFVLIDKNYGEKYLPYFTLIFFVSRCQF